MKELMFWNDAKNLAYTGEVDSKLPARVFPDKDNVHHFHPIAWVKQMKLILGTGIPPWMEIAIAEAIKYKGIKEWVEPLASAVQDKYHTYTGHPKSTSGTSWCASFVSWCLHQAEFDNPKSWSSQSFLNHSSLKETKIQYGAIVVFTDCYKNGDIIYNDNDDSFGHVTFAVGQLENDKYACLGGNQGNTIKVSDYDCSGNVFAKNKKKTKWRKMTGVYIPKSYTKNPNDEFTSDDIYKDINEVNKKIIKAEVKTKKYEST